jgi:hypothetical protein
VADSAGGVVQTDETEDEVAVAVPAHLHEAIMSMVSVPTRISVILRSPSVLPAS